MVVVTERRDAAADDELSERLSPLRRALRRQVVAGWVDGLVTLVDDGSGHPVVDRYGRDGDGPGPDRPTGGRGVSDAETAELMGRATPVPIGELTTTLTATTVMLLVEDGAVELHDPIDELLPELAHRRVLRAVGSPLHDTVPARRAVTVGDLLASRGGVGVGPGSATATPVHRSARSLGLGVFDPTESSAAPLGVDEWLQRLGTLPLMHQPGERRLGRTDAMVLGALVERLTGKPLPAVMGDRVLDPLHMYDTGFRTVPSIDHAPVTRRFTDAAAGLTSTVDDLWRFASMLVDGGRSGDASRLLATSTVRAMLTDSSAAGPDQIEGHHRGWGLGLATPAAGHDSIRVSDGFGMDHLGASWRANAVTGASAVLLTRPDIDEHSAAQLTATFWSGLDRAMI